MLILSIDRKQQNPKKPHPQVLLLGIKTQPLGLKSSYSAFSRLSLPHQCPKRKYLSFVTMGAPIGPPKQQYIPLKHRRGTSHFSPCCLTQPLSHPPPSNTFLFVLYARLSNSRENHICSINFFIILFQRVLKELSFLIIYHTFYHRPNNIYS